MNLKISLTALIVSSLTVITLGMLCPPSPAQTTTPEAPAKPRPTFFEEERRLNTPSADEITEDREIRTTSGFTETFLTDALNALPDLIQSPEGKGPQQTRNLGTSGQPPSLNFGIFGRPPR